MPPVLERQETTSAGVGGQRPRDARRRHDALAAHARGQPRGRRRARVRLPDRHRQDARPGGALVARAAPRRRARSRAELARRATAASRGCGAAWASCCTRSCPRTRSCSRRTRLSSTRAARTASRTRRARRPSASRPVGFAAGAVSTCFHDSIMVPPRPSSNGSSSGALPRGARRKLTRDSAAPCGESRASALLHHVSLAQLLPRRHARTRRMLATGGGSLFRALPTTLAMNVPYASLMVASNESLRRRLNPTGAFSLPPPSPPPPPLAAAPPPPATPSRRGSRRRDRGGRAREPASWRAPRGFVVRYRGFVDAARIKTEHGRAASSAAACARVLTIGRRARSRGAVRERKRACCSSLKRAGRDRSVAFGSGKTPAFSGNVNFVGGHAARVVAPKT